MNTMQVSAYRRKKLWTVPNAEPDRVRSARNPIDQRIALSVVDGFGGLVSRESYRSPVDRRE